MNDRRLVLCLAFQLDPEAWRPVYADLEAGRFPDLPSALAHAMAVPRNNIEPAELERIVRRHSSFKAALAYDKPERHGELRVMLSQYNHPLPPPLHHARHPVTPSA